MTTTPRPKITYATLRADNEELHTLFEAGLEGFLARTELGPPALSEALEYALLGGGKRVRPALVRLLGGDHADPADLVAAAVVDTVVDRLVAAVVDLAAAEAATVAAEAVMVVAEAVTAVATEVLA